MSRSTHSMRNFVAAALAFGAIPFHASAQPSPSAIRPLDASAPTYADLVDLSLGSKVVVRATITLQQALKPGIATDVPPGKARLYFEAQTTALLVGPDTAGLLQFLADVPLDTRGKPPKLKKTSVLLFGEAVPGRPGMLRLVAPDAMLAWTPELEARIRPILTEMVDPARPPKVTGVREAMHVPGNLAGEGETQVFLATPDGSPASLSIVRRPGQPATWGVSFAEVVDQSARPPQPETLAWYRLACALPPALPERSVIGGSAEDRTTATEDYAQVVRELGSCTRNRH